jgi:hypothetical protein
MKHRLLLTDFVKRATAEATSARDADPAVNDLVDAFTE